jgi:hypothetical protein
MDRILWSRIAYGKSVYDVDTTTDPARLWHDEGRAESVVLDRSVAGARRRQSGHGYAGYLETIVALCVVLVGAGLAARAVAGFRQRPLRELPSLWWAGLPVAAFALQELLGVLVHDGPDGLALLADPVLALGAVLELAGGLLCVLVVRKLSVAAHRAGRALAALRRRPLRGATTAAQPVPADVVPIRLRAPAYGGGKRAPPAFG